MVRCGEFAEFVAGAERIADTPAENADWKGWGSSGHIAADPQPGGKQGVGCGAVRGADAGGGEAGSGEEEDTGGPSGEGTTVGGEEAAELRERC